jgi:oxygen-independent coproporphyrinogen-3 oxidase
MSLGIYISVPFCRSKCSYCNFASGVFSSAYIERYVERLCADIASSTPARANAARVGGPGSSTPARANAARVGGPGFGRALATTHQAAVSSPVDSIYLGGGTPSLLPPAELAKLFTVIANQLALAADAEITLECAPGTLNQPILQALVSCGVNRVSLGVQSFVDREAASVARLHTRAQVLKDIENLRAHGMTNINVDLIAGLPHQTRESWAFSLAQAMATGVPHVSVYMLEVDEDSRLGRELIAGGTKYHAHFVPDEDLTADFYEMACSQLNANGISQYEISNFARAGFESRHNLKYWTRQPYLGFGVDAHSMLPAADTLQESGTEGIRLATTDSLDEFLASPHSEATAIHAEEAIEETFFLGLRLNRGVRLAELERKYGPSVARYLPIVDELVTGGLLSPTGDAIQLTPRGRLLSNEVFAKFIAVKEQEPAHR